MASAFAHALIGASIGLVFRAHAPSNRSFLRQGGRVHGPDELQRDQSDSRRERILKWTPLTCVFLAAAPDLDVAMHAFVRYQDALGHRGAFHSPTFYLFIAAFLAALCGARLWTGALAFSTLLSHSMLDMLTTGGLGIAILWPFSSERFFLPWQIIPVSPLSIGAFFGDWGKRVLISELTWALPIFALCIFYERLMRRSRPSTPTRQLASTARAR